MCFDLIDCIVDLEVVSSLLLKNGKKNIERKLLHLRPDHRLPSGEMVVKREPNINKNNKKWLTRTNFFFYIL